MIFAEPDPIDDLTALQLLPEALPPDDEPGDLICATTGVARSSAGPALDSTGPDVEPDGAG